MTLPSPFTGDPLDRDQADKLAGVFKAVADPARLQIIALLRSARNGEMVVTQLTRPTGLSQPTVSHHLRILREAGLVESDKRAVWVYYRLVPDTFTALREALTPPKSRRRR